MSGAKSEGRVLELAEKYVKFEVNIAGRAFTRTYPLTKIHAIEYADKRVVINEKGGDSKSDDTVVQQADAGSDGQRTPQEVLAYVEEVGNTKPDWFDSTPLEYPKTLKIDWPKPPQGSPWNQNVNIGQYLWSTINENPSRWKKGVVFFYYVMEVNKNNPPAVDKAKAALGHCYADLLQDYARGAYWYQQAAKAGEHISAASLANCYFQLGCKQLAEKILEPITFDRGDRYCSFVKLWSDMGELNKAIALAESTAKRGNPGPAYLAAGDACRKHGQYKKAIEYYQKIMTLRSNSQRGQQNLDNQRKWAQAAIDTIVAYENLDVSRIKDGTYQGSSMSFAGMLDVEVTVTKGRIEKVEVVKHKDKQFYSAIDDTPRQIVEKQQLKGIDAVTGATITSEAIITATAKALTKGMK